MTYSVVPRFAARHCDDLPLEIDFEAARVQTPDRTTLHAFFKLLGFRRFAAAMSDDVSVSETALIDEPSLDEAVAVTLESAKATTDLATVDESIRPRQQTLFE